eukprot:TRINITY_DN7192_c0_g1_i4.p3 TRINITY_DN7192_c0_g1~~TRINITY_DN7192_c0_g1_i4.p3  ORF type:complete len:105 (+),score=1.24 TRINITY_DN7192_c0_g1_i4:428-742(+)
MLVTFSYLILLLTSYIFINSNKIQYNLLQKNTVVEKCLKMSSWLQACAHTVQQQADFQKFSHYYVIILSSFQNDSYISSLLQYRGRQIRAYSKQSCDIANSECL